jgi:hypothetical protein
MERLDRHFKTLTKSAYERYGRAYGEVLTQWPAIAGERLAGQTAPRKITWPRQPPSAQKLGGVLVVTVDPAFALDLQYESPLLIERINRYFGYGAVAGLRIVKGPLPKPAPRPFPAAAPPDPAVGNALAGIADDRLKAALSKLGSGLKSRRRTASQD